MLEPVGPPQRDAASSLLKSTAIAVGALVIMLWPYRSLVPMWDGWIYSDCLIDMPGIAFRCAGHPALAWTAPMSLGKVWTSPDMIATFAPSLLLAVVAICGWARMVQKVLAGPSSAAALERGALVIACAVNPGILSTVLQPNVDMAVLAWGMWLFDGIAGDSILQTIIAGTLLCFSKETGVIIYGVGALVLLASRAKHRRVYRDALLLAVPVAIFVATVFLPKLLTTGDSQTIWGVSGKSGMQTLIHGFQPLNLISRHLLNYVLLVTVLQFQWIATLACVLGIVVLVRTHRLTWLDALPVTPGRRVLLTAGLSYAAITTFRTYSNLRYFALFLPFVWLAALVIARRIGIAPRMRVLAVALSIPCLIVSAWWSVDPVSRVVFGTFPLGRDRMFDMTSISHDCCGHGMDPLVYSLQYTALSRVQDRAMADLRPSDTLNIVMTRWAWLTPFDRTTSLRTIDRQRGVVAPVWPAESLAVGRPGPEHAWYLEAPNMQDSSASVARYYQPTGVVRTYDAAGARLRFVELHRLPGANQRPVPRNTSRTLP